MTIEKIRGFSIFYRLLTAFLGAVMVVCGILTMVFYNFSSALFEKQAKTHVVENLNDVERYFINTIQEDLVRELLLLARNPLVDEYLMSSGLEKDVNARAVERLFQQHLQGSRNNFGISLVDYAGKERIRVEATGRVRTYRDLAGNQLFQEIAAGAPEAIKANQPAVSSAGGVMFSVGINKSDPDIGEFGGAIIIDYRLDDLFDYLGKERQLFGENPVWVFAPNGQELLSPPKNRPLLNPLAFLADKDLQDKPLTKTIPAGLIAFQDFSLSPGKPLLRVAISLPSSVLLKDVNTILRFFILVFLGSILLISFIAYSLSRYLSRPIIALAGAASRLANGDLATQVDVKTSGEVRMLVDSFNHMATNLAESTVSKEYLDNVINSMVNPIVVTGPDGIITRGNDASHALLGYNAEELTGAELDILVAPEAAKATTLFQAIARQGFVINEEKTFIAKDGSRIPVLFSASMIQRGQGKVEGVVCSAQDISKIKEAEEELKANRAKLQAALEEISSLIQKVIKEKDVKVRFTTPELIKCHEVRGCEDIGCPCHGKEAMKCWQEVGTYHRGEAQCPHSLEINTCMDCNVFQQVTADPIIRIGEQFNNMMFILETKTLELERTYEELKHALDQMHQQEKMASIGQLAAGVAHEINNPMGFIMSNLSTLANYIAKITEFLRWQSDLVTSSQASLVCEEMEARRNSLKIPYILQDAPDLISESLEGAERVKKIVQDLKSFARTEAPRLSLADINACLESSLNIAMNEIKYKARVVKQYGDLPKIQCFPQLLNQVFVNLLVNAAQAIAEHGEITVATWSEPNKTVYVRISDTGRGIPPEIRSRLFEPFFTTKEVGKGTGLGLSIVYDIIKKHKGEIVIESEVGKGTSFEVTLPIT